MSSLVCLCTESGKFHFLRPGAHGAHSRASAQWPPGLGCPVNRGDPRCALDTPPVLKNVPKRTPCLVPGLQLCCHLLGLPTSPPSLVREAPSVTDQGPVPLSPAPPETPGLPCHCLQHRAPADPSLFITWASPGNHTNMAPGLAETQDGGPGGAGRSQVHGPPKDPSSRVHRGAPTVDPASRA